MAKFKATQQQLDVIKEDILKGSKLNDHGDYSCGCSLNPRFQTINKMCDRHSRMIGSND
jgi:hypothetical protein